ncbi:MAG: hypothetical protein KBD37_09870, partial [Burkholderiales bacterium]|nr:hypothetical protein [Burkholderiales bacterium]
MATPIQYKKAIFTNWATKLIETKGNASAIKAEKAAVLDVGKVDKKACLDKCVAMREIIASCSNLDITPGHTIDLRDRTRVKNILLKHDAGTAQWAEDVLKNGAQHLGVDVTPDELLDKLIVKMLDLVGNGFYKKDLGFNSDVDAVVEIFKFYKDLCFIQGSTPESEECRNRLVAFLFHGNGGLQGYENMTSVDQMQTFFKTDGERSSSSPFCSESLVKLFTMSAVHRHSGTDGVASFFGNWRGMVTRTACKALKEFVFTNEQGFQNALKSVMVAKLDSHISEEEVITQQNNCNSILERVNIGTIGDEAKFHDYQSATYRGTMAEIKNYFFSAYKTINNSVVDKCIENLVKKAQSFFGSYESIQINDSEIGLDKLYNSLAGVETYIQDIGIKNDRLEESADKAQSADESRELAMKSDSPAVKEATKRGYIE